MTDIRLDSSLEEMKPQSAEADFEQEASDILAEYMDGKIEKKTVEKEKVTKKKEKRSMSGKLKKRLSLSVIYIILGFYAAVILLPFLIILITSFKSANDAVRSSFFIFSDGLTVEGYLGLEGTGLPYKGALNFYASPSDDLPALILGFFRTLMFVIPPTLLGLLTSSLSAYAFVKMRFRAKRVMYAVLLGTMMIPGMITLAPQLIVYDTIRWVDTPLPLMIPGMFGAAACVFFMRQYFTGIPDSFIEAAKMDGLGFIGIFFRIVVPLAVPALLTQGLLGFIGGYNDFLGPLLYVPQMPTLQVALQTFTSSSASFPNAAMAGCVVVLVPVLVLYFVCQKFFINGIMTSGLKD